MTNQLIKAVEDASARWQAAFNAGDAEGCAACYEADAVMVAKPFGTFQGRPAITAFWRDLIAKGFADVAYRHPKISVLDENAAILSAEWTMNNAAGIITKELWVAQEDGTVLLREDHFEAHG